MPRVKLRQRHPDCHAPKRVIDQAARTAELIVFEHWGVKVGKVVRKKFNRKFASEYVPTKAGTVRAMLVSIYAMADELEKSDYDRIKDMAKDMYFTIYQNTRTGRILTKIVWEQD